MNLNIEHILSELGRESLSGKQVADILNNPIEFPTEAIERLSTETALKYWHGEMDYAAGDCIMNNLYSFWLTNGYYVNSEFSDIAWESFEAFDSGEYYRKEDGPDIDPAEKYTRPLIEKLLKKRKLI